MYFRGKKFCKGYWQSLGKKSTYPISFANTAEKSVFQTSQTSTFISLQLRREIIKNNRGGCGWGGAGGGGGILLELCYSKEEFVQNQSKQPQFWRNFNNYGRRWSSLEAQDH